MGKKKAKAVPFITDSQYEELRSCLNQAETRAALLRSKCLVLKTAAEGGATLQSLSLKLGWPQERLERLILNPDTDIEIRDLSDIMGAMGQEVRIRLTDPAPTTKE